MEWIVAFFDAFETEFDAYPETVQDTILAKAELLEREGPRFGRPHVDALTGSRRANMKELRCNVGGGIWRVLFAFGPTAKQSFWQLATSSASARNGFIASSKADERFDHHLDTMKG